MGKPTISSTFAALANAVSVDYDAGRAQPASGGAVTDASLAYDAGTDSFTLKAGSEQLVFGPGDFKVLSSKGTRHEKIDGDKITQLDLDWGAQTDFTTTPGYVVLAQLISRQRDVATSIDRYRAIDFAFGLPSAASAVPRSGNAAYDLTFSGTRSSNASANLLDVAGHGTALVNFGTGRLEIAAKTFTFNFFGGGVISTESDGEVKAVGAIVAGENRFTGRFIAQAGASDSYAGDMTGSFFGPAAEDIGGALYGASGALYYSLAFAGYGLPETAVGDTLANLKGMTRFRTVRTTLSLPGSGFLNPPPLAETIRYNADTGTYTFPAGGNAGLFLTVGPANRAADKDAGDLRAHTGTEVVAGTKIDYSVGLFDGNTDGIELTYASFMRVFTHRDSGGDGLEYIGFGSFTPPDQLPRSGSATYAGRLFGDVNDGSKIVASLNGRSDLTANFGTGVLAASLFPNRVGLDGVSTALGRYDFAGSIDAFTAAFNGAWNSGTGSLIGRFYGNAAQEYAAVFNINDPAAGNMTGIAIGKQTVP
ncbi:transferrin-binding protein-like solute binding protein [Sphingopyxis sp. LC81]|uniref:transferrin-binding protein-like solute binding protein n=1 Tax=Sphingopyxis sp. LC81 TaxID=1502850 RepID=UPI000566DFAC|nr:transferrin-binding protein-like solute binding protein [Sphingopyxis sp. LC81]